MPLKKLVRGEVSLDIDEVADLISDNAGIDNPELVFVGGENWLSVPLSVEGEYFVKVITPQNNLTHSFFTAIRNIGVRVSGADAFFEGYESPAEMARHEFNTTKRLREIGVKAPEPIEVIESKDTAIILFEYLDGYQPLSEISIDDELLDRVFQSLRKMHSNNIAHGDFSLENVLVVGSDPYFIDSTHIKEDRKSDAVAYDLACAIGALSEEIGEERVIKFAEKYYSKEELESTLDFLMIARLRPGIQQRFSILKLWKEISSR